VELWNRSGRNAEALLAEHRYLRLKLREQPWTAKVFVSGSGLELLVAPPASLLRFPPPPEGTQVAIENARLAFLALLLFPGRDWLSERPCARCDRYYFRKTARQKVYCSRKCGKDGTAAFATRQRLAAEHELKLKVASQEAQIWASARTKDDWKTWVCKRPSGRREGLTPKFLTRAVNKGELTEPTKGER